MSFTPDTIVAIATPLGRGGIGVVRLSGSRAAPIGLAMLRLAGELAPGRARFGYLLDPDAGETGVLDEVVATFFAGPRSYTGEDVLEIAAHGAPVVLEAVVQRALSLGARLAEPGEFTQRAFLAGRLDLTQAEAVHDLISATTLHQARSAASQMGGSLSRVIRPVKQQLVHLIAALEAGIDFAEDDLDLMPEQAIVTAIDTLTAPLLKLQQSYSYGRAIREGLTLAIIGRPNAGKSSLFNALLGRDRAIVTPVAGTTRDVISERTTFAGIPVEVTDTAGIRHATDEIEALGIARSRETLSEAAIVLLVLEAEAGSDATDLSLLEEIGPRPVLLVANKSDLASPERLQRTRTALARLAPGRTVVFVSARTGDGLPELREAIHALLGGEGNLQDSTFLTSQRQLIAVGSAVEALVAARYAVGQQTPHEMVLLDLHTALDALDTLTGTTTPDEVLHLIFSTFCIGK